jgi:hypothetical protein
VVRVIVTVRVRVIVRVMVVIVLVRPMTIAVVIAIVAVIVIIINIVMNGILPARPVKLAAINSSIHQDRDLANEGIIFHILLIVERLPNVVIFHHDVQALAGCPQFYHRVEVCIKNIKLNLKQCCGSAFVSMQIRIQHFRSRRILLQGFEGQKW